MAKRRGLGKPESIVMQLVGRGAVGIGGGTGQGIAVLEPFEQVAVTATRRAEGRMRLDARLAADRAFPGGAIHRLTSWA